MIYLYLQIMQENCKLKNVIYLNPSSDWSDSTAVQCNAVIITVTFSSVIK